MLQDDPSAELSKGIYRSISKSGVYRAAAKPPILPCPNVIEWLTRKVGHERRNLLDFEGHHVESYKDLVLNKIYHFKEPQIKVTQEWLQNTYDSIDFLNFMKGWWSEGNFRSKPTPTGWKISKF